MKSFVKVSAPATIANFGPGFDTFGLALDQPRDVVELSLDVYETQIETVPDYSIPTKKNAAFAAANSIAWKHRINTPFRMKITKGIRPGSGIGSSAASSVGAALAMSIALDIRVEDGELIQASSMGEKMASGAAHIDNVTASLLGGFTIVSSRSPVQVISIPPEQLPSFSVVIALPDLVLETRRSRAAIPRTIPIEDAVENISLSSSMVHALMRKDVGALGKYLKDALVLPYRKPLIPGYDKVQRAAMDAGALGVSISGSGPAVFALTDSDPKSVAKAMEVAFRSAGFKSQTVATKPGRGAEVLDVR